MGKPLLAAPTGIPYRVPEAKLAGADHIESLAEEMCNPDDCWIIAGDSSSKRNVQV
jgi:hypothetical protein